jgi:hypothetical protein
MKMLFFLLYFLLVVYLASLWFISRYREQVSSHRRRRFKLIKR